MAEQKRKLPSMSADRLTDYRRTQQRAGKSKSPQAVRKAQNMGVKDGTVRIGRGGRSYNVYDSKSGTWKRGVVQAASAAKPAVKRGRGNTGKGNYGGKGGFTNYSYRNQFGPGWEKQSGMRK